jgi:extradiol dioxygenase family protein
MGVIAFNHFNIRAPKQLLAEVRSFYADVIGLEEGFRPDFGVPGHWLYLGEQPVLHLMEWSEEKYGEAPGKTQGYLDHVAFSCEDLEGFIAQLERHLVSFKRRDFESPQGGGFTQLVMHDPAGNGVELNFAHA